MADLPELYRDNPGGEQKIYGPRSTDQSKLPAIFEGLSLVERAASQVDKPTDKPRTKGIRGGIGSLKKAPWFALAQLTWDSLSPEQKSVAEQYGKDAYGSLGEAYDASMAWLGRNRFAPGAAGGLDWVKNFLFPESDPESGKGIMSLPDLTKPAPVYSSAVSDAVNALSMERGDAAQIRSTIANTPGVKADEMKYQLDKFLEGKGKVTKKEIQDFIADNPVTINDTILSDIDKQRETMTWEEGKTYDSVLPDRALFTNPEFGYRIIEEPDRYGVGSLHYAVTDPAGKMLARVYETLEEAKIQAQIDAMKQGYIRDDVTQFNRWTLGRGSFNDNYREILLELPHQSKRRLATPREREMGYAMNATGDITAQIDAESMVRDVENEFRGHWQQAQEDTLRPVSNVFAHLRVNDKVDDAGNDVLFVEEFQSDLHQGARNLRNNEIERIAKDQWKKWLSEEVHANIDSIREGIPYESVRSHAAGWDKNRDRFIKQAEKQVPEDFGYRTEAYAGGKKTKLPDAPFKKTWHELVFRRALRLAAEEGKDMVAWTPGDMQVERYELKGEEAEGMRKFYDGIIKNYANKFGKKFGVKAERSSSLYTDQTGLGMQMSPYEVWSLKITPEMRRHLLGKGIQKFTHGGFVDKPLYEDARMIG